MNATSSPRVRFVAWGVLAIVMVAVVALYVQARFQRSNLPRLSQVQAFDLTNQLGQATSAHDLLGRVWVADIIFTRCGGPCPKMTEEMSKLQTSFPPGAAVSFVTMTTDPDFDTPAVLKRYGEKFGADFSRWMFLTGTKAQIKNLAVDSLKLAAVEKGQSERETENDLFVHSTIFVLIDKAGSMRGVYESLEPGFQEKIRTDIGSLLREN